MGCGGSKTTAGRDAGTPGPSSGARLGHTAFIIVDVQNDFISGSLKVGADAETIVPMINKVREDVPFTFVVHTQDSHPADHISFWDNHEGKNPFELIKVTAPDGKSEIDQVLWPRHCVQQSEGWKFHPDLVVAETDFVQAKGTNQAVDSYSGFFDNASETSTGLDTVLHDQGITDVFVCGLAYDFCVGLTACDAAKLGFTVHLIEDLTRAVADDSATKMKAALVENNVHICQAADVAAIAAKKDSEMASRMSSPEATKIKKALKLSSANRSQSAVAVAGDGHQLIQATALAFKAAQNLKRRTIVN